MHLPLVRDDAGEQIGCDSYLHRVGNAQAVVYSTENVPREMQIDCTTRMQTDGRFQVRQLFTESFCQARKTVHLHPHCQVLPFHEVVGGCVTRRTLDITHETLGGE